MTVLLVVAVCVAWISLGLFSAFVMRTVDEYVTTPNDNLYWLKNRSGSVFFLVFSGPVSLIFAFVAIYDWCTKR